MPRKTSFQPSASALPPAPSEARPASATDLWEEDSLRYRGILRDIVNRSAALVEKLHGQATVEAQPDNPPPDVTVALERITRIIHDTIILAQEIAEPLPVAPVEARPTPERVEPAWAEATDENGNVLKKRTKKLH